MTEQALSLPGTMPVTSGRPRGVMGGPDDAAPRRQPVRAAGGLDAADARTVVEAAYEQFQRELFTFAVHASRDMNAAEDIVQEAYLRLHSELLGGREIDNVRGWLFRVAGNLVMSRGRRLGIVSRWLAKAPKIEHHDQTPEGAAIANERTRAVEAAMTKLTPDARTAVLLAGRGFGIAEIAQTLGRTELATRALLCRTRLRIRTLAELDTE
jgi:RNA polymerase sigma factor (sigma-70 family)